MALLNFALLCIDLVGWPAIALVYPLFVSIRAVETGSGYHMRKLFRYWIIFSLFSLFEFAFVKVIEWIPFWSGARLTVIFCLVMPQFEGACLAYQGLVSSFIDRFGMLMEERLCKRRTFLDVVDKYINENGPEALEKLIASQMTPPEAIVENRCLETLLLKKSEQEWTCGLCKMTSVGESTLNAHLRGSMHKSKLEILKARLLNAKDTGSSPLVQHTRSFSAAWDLRGTYAAAEFKERMPPKEPENTLLKKAEQEWTCDLCKVTMASKSMLNAHLQGSKHKSRLESPKACSLDSKDTGPSPLVEHAQSIPAGWDLKGTYAAAEVKQMMPTKETAEKSGPETPVHEKAHQEWNCDQCKVTTTDPLTSNGHLQWGEDNAKLETILNESLLDAKDTGHILPLVQHTQPISAAWDLNGTLEAAKDKELMLPKETTESRLPETPLLKKAQQEWPAFITNAEHAQLVPAGWDMNGTLETAKDKDMMPPKETAEMRLPETPVLKKSQQDMTGDMSKVTTESELMLNDHLQGSQHNSKLETTLKASLLEAKDTGPSPSQVQHLQSVSAAWDLNGTYAAFEEEKIMPPKETAERRLPATPLLKKDKQEWTGDLCNVPTESVSTLNDHLEASNLNSKLETTLEVERAPSIPAAWEPKGSYASAEAKEIMSPNETAEKWGTGTPLLKKSCQEWTCDLCKVKTPCEIMLNGHLQGRKHKAKLETIRKESLVDAKDTGSFSPLVQHTQPVFVFAACDLKGTPEAANDKEIMPPKETAELRLPETPLLKKAQQERTGDRCTVTTESESVLNDHLQGSQHKSNLETTLDASLFEAKDTGPKPSQVQHLQSVSAAWDLNGTHAAFEEEKIMPPKETAERRLPATPLLKKDKQEWTGDLCKVPTESVSTLNDHLEASNPNSKLETTLEVERAPSIPAAWEPKGSYASAEAKEIMLPNETAEKWGTGTPLLKKSCQEWTCDLCKVKTPCEITLNGHLQGRKHKAKLETIRKEGLVDAKDTGSFSPLVQHTQPVFVFAACNLKGTPEAANDKEIMPPKETAELRLPETPLLKKAQQERTGDRCTVTTESESVLNDHLQGSQHKSNLETTLDASLFEAKDTGPSPSVPSMELGSATWDLKGTYADAEVKDLMPPKETAENRLPETLLKKVQPEGTGDGFNVTTKSESMLNDHVKGNQPKSKLERALEASLLKAKDTGLSSLETKHKDKLEFTVKESLLELEKHTASKNGHVEGSDSHRDVQVVKSVAKNGSPAALKEVQYAHPLKVPEKTFANTEVIETLPPPEASRAVSPPLKQEWSCALCKVKATGEKNLNAHLLGSKHKAKLESLKRRNGKLVVLEISGTFRHWCILCDVKLATDVALASHVGGKRHASRIDEIEKLETSLSAPGSPGSPGSQPAPPQLGWVDRDTGSPRRRRRRRRRGRAGVDTVGGSQIDGEERK